eukprot:349930_1
MQLNTVIGDILEKIGFFGGKFCVDSLKRIKILIPGWDRLMDAYVNGGAYPHVQTALSKFDDVKQLKHAHDDGADKKENDATTAASVSSNNSNTNSNNNNTIADMPIHFERRYGSSLVNCVSFQILICIYKTCTGIDLNQIP